MTIINWIKKNKLPAIIFPILIVLVGVIFFLAGSAYQSSQQVSQAALDWKLENEQEYTAMQDKISAAEETIQTAKDLEDQIVDKRREIPELDSKISEKQAELDSLNGQILEVKGQPISLPAGDFTVGVDCPAGRYQISGESNFIVRSAFGELKINTILGNGIAGSGDYIGTLEDGDTIQNRAPSTLTPVQ